MSILDTKEKNCSGKEKDKRTDDLLELTEVLFLVLIRIRDMFLNNLSYSRLNDCFEEFLQARGEYMKIVRSKGYLGTGYIDH